jgi:hypothetical protein
MTNIVQRIIGPRVPYEELQRRGLRYRLPGVFLSFARLALLVSMFLPYWNMTLEAPQYPEGLNVSAYVNHLTGDVREIDGLNHYIGMRPLEEAAQFERSVSIAAIIALILLVEGAVHIHSRWAAVLTLPAILFPPFFLIDLYFWLNHFGQNLDPAAPLSGAIEPFTPPVLGVGVIGQFRTVATAGPGLILATIAAVLVIVGLFFPRRAYKPLMDAQAEVAHG